MKLERNITQIVELPANPIPIFIIGAGGIVKDAHLPAYTLAGFSVAGIFDLDLSKSKQLQLHFPEIQNIYRSLEELIQAASMYDKVVFDIAVPAKYVLAILEQLPDGSAVLIQKLMGEDLVQARQIRDLYRVKIFQSAVNFQLRYAPYVLIARQMIDKGWIGWVYDIEIKVCVYTPCNLWSFLYDLPRVEILYHSIQYFDLIRSFQRNPERVFASTLKHSTMPELASTRSGIILDYDKMTQARVMTIHRHDFGLEYQESYLKIEGTKVALMIRIGLSLDYPKGVPPRFKFDFSNEKEWQEVSFDGGWFPYAFIETMAGLQRYVQGKDSCLPHSTEDSFHTMRLVETAYRSNSKGVILFNNNIN